MVLERIRSAYFVCSSALFVSVDLHVVHVVCLGKRGSADSDVSSAFSPRSSLAGVEGSPPCAKAGTVVTSSRASKRRYILHGSPCPFYSFSKLSMGNLELLVFLVDTKIYLHKFFILLAF